VWTITILLTGLRLGGVAEHFIWGACVAASALLVIYAWTSLLGFLIQGTKPDDDDPLASPAPVEVVAAAIVAAGARDEPLTYTNLTNLLHALLKPPTAEEAVTGPQRVMVAAEPHRWVRALQRRSALP
jgi:hypothetical protein